MLVVSRKEHESIRIEPAEGLDPSLTLRDAFAQGPIVLTLTHVGLRRVRMAIEAPPALRIGRSTPHAGGLDDAAGSDETFSSTFNRHTGTPR